MNKSSIYLVTGGAGFIGSTICRELLKQGHRVRVLDNFSTGRESNLTDIIDHIELIRGDLADMKDVEKAVNGVDYILHQGALPSVPRSIKDPLASHNSNINGTLNILMGAKTAGVKRIVFASSSSVYGNTPTLPKSEDMKPEPLSPYALTKLTGEHYCRIFYQVYGLETVALRYFNVFGPNQNPDSQYSAVIPRFITLLKEGKPPIIFGDGNQSRDFTYVGNVVSANLLALTAPSAPGRVFNIACGSRITVNELAIAMAKAMGLDIKPVYDEKRQGDVLHSLADINSARRILGYEPRIGMEEGLERTIKAYIEG